MRWVLDPIDGTVNFVLGLPAYAVSVAAEVDGTVVGRCGVQPGDRRAVPRRARRRRVPGRRAADAARVRCELAAAVIGTGFGYDVDRRAAQGAVVARLLPRIADIRRVGAASLDLCAVAAGRLDGYFEAGLSPWDHAAGGLDRSRGRLRRDRPARPATVRADGRRRRHRPRRRPVRRSRGTGRRQRGRLSVSSSASARRPGRGSGLVRAMPCAFIAATAVSRLQLR